MHALPEVVAPLVGEYLGRVQDELAGVVEGLYLVGSVALGDFRPGASDVDFVAVTGKPVDAGQVEVLRGVHGGLAAPPHFDGVYVTWAELADDPRTVPPGVHLSEGTVEAHSSQERHPVTWHTLARHGIAVRGPEPAGLDIWTDAAALADSVAANLDDYWGRWLTRGSDPADRIAEALLGDWAVGWVVLGVSRLHYTLATGGITSKHGAGRYAREHFPARYHRIAEEALRIREDAPGSGYASPAERRAEVLDFLDFTITDAHTRYA